jgi:hypothetical protein
MSSLSTGYGVALNNQAAEIMRIGEALGPVTLTVENEGSAELVISVHKLSDDSIVMLDKDTAVTTPEDTGYTGNTSDVDFSGQVLNHLPIIPGTVEIAPTAGGASVNAVDTNGDGILWTVESTPETCGTINYFTGALTLGYPSAHAPNTGKIYATYHNQDKTVAANGVRAMQIQNLPPSETFIIKAAAKADNSPVRMDATLTF